MFNDTLVHPGKRRLRRRGEQRRREWQIFGNETPSLCDDEAWNRVRLAIRPAPECGCLVLLSTDGYANSYPTDGAFDAVAVDYLKMVVKHGMAAVDENLARILGHVSTVGSGDDVSLALMYFPKETGEQP